MTSSSYIQSTVAEAAWEDATSPRPHSEVQQRTTHTIMILRVPQHHKMERHEPSPRPHSEVQPRTIPWHANANVTPSRIKRLQHKASVARQDGTACKDTHGRTRQLNRRKASKIEVQSTNAMKLGKRKGTSLVVGMTKPEVEEPGHQGNTVR